MAALASKSYALDSIKLLLLGALVEAGRRLFSYLSQRVHFNPFITADFKTGDPTFDWVKNFLLEENVWRRARSFKVSAKSSARKWKMKSAEDNTIGNADYVPTYKKPQIFHWGGYWIEVERHTNLQNLTPFETRSSELIRLRIFSYKMNALTSLVEEARMRYNNSTSPSLIVHTVEMPLHGGQFVWDSVKEKTRRPLSSVVLEDGVIDSIIKDARDFMAMESWYVKTGIPHRRGYLLYGPPGTGKSSTIFALAGELGVEIYSLSLASKFVDDAYLSRAAASIPKHSIFLIEDIDCAFRARESSDDEPEVQPQHYPAFPPGMMATGKSAVTLSGLLNVLDGVGSEEGKLFFATTNYIDRLDPALIRPGRIDMKVQYHLASRKQAAELYRRFFSEGSSDNTDAEKPVASTVDDRAEAFANLIPPHEFSTAELQGHLLGCKMRFADPVASAPAWIEQERKERDEKAEKDNDRKQKIKEKREQRERRMAPIVHLNTSILPEPKPPGRLLENGD